MAELEVYIDGACSGNPGPAGIGVLVCEGQKPILRISKYLGDVTNNIAELESLKIALQNLSPKDNIKIYLDSQYVIGLMTDNWKAKANKELVQFVRSDLKRFHHLKFIKVKGHSDNNGNAAADKFATGSIETYRKQVIKNET